ncbi:MAG: molybdopterin-dependent oxidoreductase [Nitrospira sp.]|nr:molybdopterin-dependent oxidoreductase [bacterium]MBL7049562.1 molybdopterin-dependent oxidoreductase [Nitrospira sp.]
MMARKRYGLLINLDRCIGCYGCQVTCKSEHSIPFGTFRCRVQAHLSGSYPDIQKIFIPHLCNHCDHAPCIEKCKQKALYRNTDGVVVANKENCIGCNQCAEQCPYNAIELNTLTGKVEKCDLCYSNRISKGELPVCVESCMGKAISFGDIADSKSDISIAMLGKNLLIAGAEYKTNPAVFYISKKNIEFSKLTKYEHAENTSTRRTSTAASIPTEGPDVKMVNTADVMCPSECGIRVRVEDGVATKIYGNPHTLVNNGTLCAKGASGLQLTYSPHRIKTPLKRVGQRGEEQWAEISWEEALDYIAEKMVAIKHTHGAEAVFMDCGDLTDRDAYYRIFHAFGTPNTFNHGSICDPNRKWGQFIMLGDERPLPDLQRPILLRDDEGKAHLHRKHDAKLIMSIGSNPFVATRFNYMSAGIPAAREENNCIYIVADPAFTNSAAHADMWLPVIPGSDAALMAAMLLYIIENDSNDYPSNNYIDHEFIESYTIGWDEFRDSFTEQARQVDPSCGLKYFSLEWAEEKTGVSADNIRRASHMFGITKPASIEIGIHGTAHHTNGDVTSIIMAALCLITGNLDRPGGLVFIDSQKARKGVKTMATAFLKSEVTRTIDGQKITAPAAAMNKDKYGDYPAAWKGVLADLPEKIRKGVRLKHGPFKGHQYPVKAFVTRAGNPVITAGNTPDWINALTTKDETGEYALQLMVFIDTHITVSGQYADIILPETGYLEHMGLSDVYTMSPEIALRDKVIEPLYESRSPYAIMTSLAEALIRKKDPDIRKEDFHDNYADEEAFINEILSDAPAFSNSGTPLPYPAFPEGCKILGAPDNPFVIWGSKVIKKGELLTVEWLRKNNGVAIWPASYYRYKKRNGSISGTYPKTKSGKFEFTFNYLRDINTAFETSLPETFYWSECKWNPGNSEYAKLKEEYPFQLISGRVHHAMTMTVVCPSLGETETECMKMVNDPMPYNKPLTPELPDTYRLSLKEDTFQKDSLSIPVLALNTQDGIRLKITSGEVLRLENPLGKSLRGKAYLSDEIMPGVIKTTFGPGGQAASGTGFMSGVSSYTPNINDCVDPDNITPFTGMPGFGDIMVKLIRE